jgi:hypothetical protein
MEWGVASAYRTGEPSLAGRDGVILSALCSLLHLAAGPGSRFDDFSIRPALREAGSGFNSERVVVSARITLASHPANALDLHVVMRAAASVLTALASVSVRADKPHG